MLKDEKEERKEGRMWVEEGVCGEGRVMLHHAPRRISPKWQPGRGIGQQGSAPPPRQLRGVVEAEKREEEARAGAGTCKGDSSHH